MLNDDIAVDLEAHIEPGKIEPVPQKLRVAFDECAVGDEVCDALDERRPAVVLVAGVDDFDRRKRSDRRRNLGVLVSKRAGLAGAIEAKAISASTPSKGTCAAAIEPPLGMMRELSRAPRTTLPSGVVPTFQPATVSPSAATIAS